MSGFLKRDTKTVNPAGGVNPASSPNVSQYGWTSYDAGNVNQIIQYVDMCKQYAESAKESADFVASKFEDIQKFITYLEALWSQLEPVANNIEVIYEDILQKHKEVKTMHTDTLAATKDAILSSERSRDSAAASEASAVLSTENAISSEASRVAAEKAAQEAADVAEELRKGQVYRGTWNIEENNSYPPKPDTNSVWDVTLKEDSTEFNFDGQKWFWGDRLLFLKDDDAFSQIESGSTVVSVNGKNGAVTLNATDVGAVGLAGGTLTGPLFWKNDKNYINYSGSEMVITTKEGKLVLEGKDGVAVRVGSTDHNVYHQGYKPSAADVGAVGLAGPQTMTGQLNGVRFAASDSYGFVSRLRSTQGLFLGNNANDARTIIGGGGDVVGDASGTIHLRPNGITDQAGEIVVRASGQISASVEPSAADHLTNDGYVKKLVKVVADKVETVTATANGAMPKAGGEFTGQVILANRKGALLVNNQKSIAYQDQSGTMFHTFVVGNTLKWSHGTNGELDLMQLSGNGTLSTQGPQYARSGHIAESHDGGTWIGIETPNAASPYISIKDPSLTNPVKALEFNGSEIIGSQRIAANHFRVGVDAGLKFSPYADLRGITWGMGEDSTTGTFGISKYDKGSLVTTPIRMDNHNNVFIKGLTAQGGYTKIQNETGGQTLLELESSDKHARLMWVEPSTGDFNFSISSGGGAELTRLSKWDSAGNFITYKGVYVNTASTTWGGYGNSGICPLQTAVNVRDGEWHPMVTSPPYLRIGAGGSDGYLNRWQIGHYRTPGANNGDFVVAMTGDGLLSKTLRYHFKSEGQLTCAGTLDGAHWAVGPGGNIYGSIFGAYSTIVNWCNASFAPASDGRLKTVLGDSTKSALDVVEQFQFKKFTWNENAGEVYTTRNKKVTDIGLIAQEVEAIDPALVKTIKTEGEGGVDLKALDTAAMLALALKAIQELQEEVRLLKEKN